MTPPPERIPLSTSAAPGLELRRWTEDDAERVFLAVTESFEHLHPWAAWAAEPPTFEDERRFVRQAIREWDEGTSYTYGIFDPAGTVQGSAALMVPAGPELREIGYWTHAAYLRRGLATLSAGALTRAAFDSPGVNLVQIRCDEANVASATVPRKLGYRLDRYEPREIGAPAESGRTMCWTLTREAFR
ncbi:GNAT family N-acetyltransferase [Actinomadura sp. 9N407]|uniref:GNAT family N-acetyltransferase n=1 Tax=Actinomadura sp. 9N407 TaxID=3375154 RepID=UPI0037A15ED7